ncbi:MAG: hypothetical protein IJJ64_03765 [Butyrivibrio sp.]|nr:hypothetical protein [Butyrivibrio sp.]
MTREKLYEIAFQYKKAGLWKKLWDNDIFAIKLSSGEIGYISIMGKGGQHNALGLYIGEKGFGSYRILQGLGDEYSMPEYVYHELVLQQNCMQMALEEKDYMIPEELDEVRAYAKKNGIRLAGKNAYPQFVKYEPNCHPWKVKTDEDMLALYEALKAAILMSEILSSATPESIGINPVEMYTTEVPLFEVEGDKLVSRGFTLLPGPIEEKYEHVRACNQIFIASVKKLPKNGIWESELVRLMEPVQNDPEETPHYPAVLLVVESESGYLLHVPAAEYAEKNPEVLLDDYAAAWVSLKAGPKEIRCRDERTFALIKDFCDKTGVKISIYDGELSALDEAEGALFAHLSGRNEEKEFEYFMKAISQILTLNKEEFKELPGPMIDQLKMLLEEGILPEDMAKELQKKLKGI